MSARAGWWSKREAWAAYLERYADALEGVVLGVKVSRLEKRPGGWHVHTSAGSFTARFVVIATGHDRVPYIPDWPGKEKFAVSYALGGVSQAGGVKRERGSRRGHRQHCIVERRP